MANPVARILAIDDDANIRELLRARLASHGYAVALAEDGPAGLAAIAQEIPDLVIVDLMMPGMDGLSFIKRLRSNPETESLPVLMLSARDRSIDKTMGLEAGVDDYLGKPFNSAELMARIAALLRRSRREQAQTTEPPQRGRLIAFVGAKGGVGTTTVAANLGVALARAGTSTIVVDLAPPPGTAAAILGLAPRRRLDRLPLARPELMTSGMVEDTLLDHSSGLRLLLGPANDRQAPPPAAVAPLLQLVATLADRVLIDLGSEPTDAGRAAMQLAWEVWVVTTPEPVAVARASTTIQAMEQAGVRPQKVGLLANQTSPEMNMGRAELEQATGRGVTFAVPAAPRACFEAQRRGVALAELAAELPTGQALTRIAATLAEQRSATLSQPVHRAEPAATTVRA